MMKFRWASRTFGAAFVGLVAVWGLATFGGLELGRLRARVDQLETEKKQLAEFVRRLGATRKVAQADILAQKPDDQGRMITVLRWQELAANDVMGPPVQAEVIGSLVYFEALVVKFDHQLVGKADPQRGESLALFRRVFGDRQPPDSGYPLAQGASAHHAGGEGEIAPTIWARFWELVEDPLLARQYGIRVAQIEAPAVSVKVGQTWEITLDAAGGLNVRLVAKGRTPALGQQTSRPGQLS